ncbi:MAG: ATP-binding cassette domain-containing protein [Tissierellia bacterium]|nr:ATP-binding cassette domain-containing protein [Tissierellia bacterium]
MKLSIDALSKSFGEKNLWKEISLDFPQEGITTIQGPSGQGKTTLLRCLAGLERADGGRILVDGVEVEERERTRRLGFVFQDYHLFPHMTVRQNLCLAPKYHGMDPETMDRKVDFLLSELDLVREGDRYPDSLSGGQKQRVAIARAMMLDPELICFDEPTSALDRGTIQRLVGLLQQLKQQGMGMIIVTHDTEFAKEVSDTIVVLENGTARVAA